MRGSVRGMAMGATSRHGAAGTQQRGCNPHGSITARVSYWYDVVFALSLWPVPNVWGCNPHAAAQCVYASGLMRYLPYGCGTCPTNRATTRTAMAQALGATHRRGAAGIANHVNSPTIIAITRQARMRTLGYAAYMALMRRTSMHPPPVWQKLPHAQTPACTSSRARSARTGTHATARQQQTVRPSQATAPRNQPPENVSPLARRM